MTVKDVLSIWSLLREKKNIPIDPKNNKYSVFKSTATFNKVRFVRCCYGALSEESSSMVEKVLINKNKLAEYK